MTDATVNHLIRFQKTGAADSFQEFWAAAETFVSQVVARQLFERLSWHDLEFKEGPVASPAADPKSKFAASELQRVVAACVAELAADQRQLYQFLFVDRISQRQCAGKLGMSAAGVCRHRDKMLATLATKLAVRGIDASWCGPAA